MPIAATSVTDVVIRPITARSAMATDGSITMLITKARLRPLLVSAIMGTIM